MTGLLKMKKETKKNNEIIFKANAKVRNDLVLIAHEFDINSGS